MGGDAGRGLPGACSPAHIGVHLNKVPPGAVQQRMKHHLDINLSGEETGMKKEGAWPSGGRLSPSQPPCPHCHSHSDSLSQALGWVFYPHCRDEDTEVLSG